MKSLEEEGRHREETSEMEPGCRSRCESGAFSESSCLRLVWPSVVDLRVGIPGEAWEALALFLCLRAAVLCQPFPMLLLPWSQLTLD